MEFLKLRTIEISICKEHIIQGPPVQLYQDNLRTHVPMCEDYLQKGKNSREIGRKGKTENWSETVARGVVQSLGQMAAINVFHYSIVKPLLFCSWQSFVLSIGNIDFIFLHTDSLALGLLCPLAESKLSSTMVGVLTLDVRFGWLNDWLESESNVNKFKMTELGYVGCHNPWYCNL